VIPRVYRVGRTVIVLIEPVIPLGYTPPIDPLCVACRICKADVGTKCDQTWARNPRTTTD